MKLIQLSLLGACLIFNVSCSKYQSNYDPSHEVHEPSICSTSIQTKFFPRGEETEIGYLAIDGEHYILSRAIIVSNKKGPLKIWGLYEDRNGKPQRVDIPTNGEVVKLDNVCVKAIKGLPNLPMVVNEPRNYLTEDAKRIADKEVTALILSQELPGGP